MNTFELNKALTEDINPITYVHELPQEVLDREMYKLIRYYMENDIIESRSYDELIAKVECVCDEKITDVMGLTEGIFETDTITPYVYGKRSVLSITEHIYHELWENEYKIIAHDDGTYFLTNYEGNALDFNNALELLEEMLHSCDYMLEDVKTNYIELECECGELKQDNKLLKAENESLKREIETLRKQADTERIDVHAENCDLRDKIHDLGIEIEDLKESLENAEYERDEAQAEIRRLQNAL